jgi:hypothetical protein
VSKKKDTKKRTQFCVQNNLKQKKDTVLCQEKFETKNGHTGGTAETRQHFGLSRLDFWVIRLVVSTDLNRVETGGTTRSCLHPGGVQCE